jgi:Zn-dependent peptidase ImmA (M78 family)
LLRCAPLALSYRYQSRSPEELEEYAGVILSRYPGRVSGFVVDVEGILEDLGLTILPRRGGLGRYADGYTPKDPRYIVLAEEAASYAPRYRYIVAEELCHRILEYELWKMPAIPRDAEGHWINFEQLEKIEVDAVILAGAVLMPQADFKSRYLHHFQQLQGLDANPDKIIKRCVEIVSEEVQVWEPITAKRAQHLRLITIDQLKRIFTDKLLF